MLREFLNKITSLKWAAKALAVVLSTIACVLLFPFIIIIGSGFVMMILEELPRFTVMMTVLIIVFGVIAIGAVVLPKIREISAKFLKSADGRNVLFWFVVALWFLVFFRRVLTETPLHNEIALTLIVSGIVLGTIAFTNFLILEGQTRILAAICTYISIMILFAGIYNLIFLKSPTSFVFSPDSIAGKQTQENFARKLSEFRELQYHIYLATILEGNFEAGFDALVAHRNGDLSPQRINDELSIQFVYIEEPGSDEIRLNCYNNGNQTELVTRGGYVRAAEEEIVFYMYFAESAQDFHFRVQQLQYTYQEKLKQQGDIINSTFAGDPDWNFLDFLYFSGMTQISANFGEIIPNSNLVRLVVFLQAFSGMVDIGLSIMLFRIKGQTVSAEAVVEET